jgi:hypothetical protein
MDLAGIGRQSAEESALTGILTANINALITHV